ncbi:prepilin-type N-terminal cleavage/methylation domain-containing protein [Bradyrhizobium diazoefficiens]|nr:prepilin-type N-terminal cleavage/methylation domain-containing protein [Bradyrhizobium diazoefficiens]QQO22382.1 prepilin-type N-terminal cleavage/methylation domain-containing protein [Bradyrhizobium diazoefficiens]
MSTNGESGQSGFSLIEALVALALTGLVLSALANITAQWLPNWNRGIDRVQETEQVGIAIQRIAGDLATAEFVPASRELRRPLFDGSAFALTFVRTALGPNTGIGLDIVRIGEAEDRGRMVTVRSRAPFGPLAAGASPSEQIHLSDPVVLLRSPLRLSFSYAGPDRVFRDSWKGQEKLPVTIMLTIRDAATGRVLSASSVAPVHINAAAGDADDAVKETADDSAKNNGGVSRAGRKQDGS